MKRLLFSIMLVMMFGTVVLAADTKELLQERKAKLEERIQKVQAMSQLIVMEHRDALAQMEIVDKQLKAFEKKEEPVAPKKK